MKAPESILRAEKLSKQKDSMINKTSRWRGETLSQLRALIKRSGPAVVKEVKWRKPSDPVGFPVWSHGGIVCFGTSSRMLCC